ncbi:Serine hydroxymethyltransferase 4 [Camellia lanceoleosa]|uniref:Serine hydroxymethyltransferase 4 n=1 Tax=Camellia lanceoleosa TaxID=1840588 RepID=A0ACC0F742_9ERIC|nr:Serine hydroxymethyltransferase 4 [Camellia lanceoleosa]
MVFYAAIASVAAYNNHKLKKEASQGSSDESQHAESTPLTSSSTIESNKVKKLCDLFNITVNKNVVFDDSSALSPGGVRIGTSAMTSRGLFEKDFEQIAEFLHRSVTNHIEDPKGEWKACQKKAEK